MNEAPDRTARVLSVLVLAAMIAFSATANRDDEAWKAMIKVFDGWIPAEWKAKDSKPTKPETPSAEPAEQNAD